MVGFAAMDVQMSSKTCDACVYYRCTGDNGRNIMGGFGCYEDLEKICQVVPSNVKESIKKNIKTSFHYDENYAVVTCSSGANCMFDEYAGYYDVNPDSKIKVDTLAKGTCEFGVAFSPSLQINLWILYGIIIAGFANRFFKAFDLIFY